MGGLFFISFYVYNQHYSTRSSFQATCGNFAWFLYYPECLVYPSSSIECPGRVGVGECAPLPKLSCDDLPDYEQVLRSACQRLEQTGELDIESLRGYPSILFDSRQHCAITKHRAGHYGIPFSRGEVGIPINGLIWMGSFDRMLQQIEVKMQAGYRCIKLKIGAINFEEELALLRHIRAHYSAREIELRVDANGASPADAMDKLNRLAELDLHSIEQPIRAGQWRKWPVWRLSPRFLLLWTKN